MQGATEATGLLSLGAIFTLLFVTLGPLKVLGPFAQMTRDADDSTLRQIAVRAFALAVISVVIGGFLGRALIENWNISVPAMLIAGGIIFLLVGLGAVLEQYHAEHPAPPPLPDKPLAAAMRITFPTVVTPYGIAAVIVMFANSHESSRTLNLLAILLAVMVLNLLAMLFARRIMAGPTLLALKILGAVLGVLQVALAIEMILRGLHGIWILPK